MLELPITNDPAQTFITQLGDEKYRFDIQYNEVSGVWTADISDPVSNVLILAGITLLPGANLLEPYNLELNNLFAVRADRLGTVTPEDFGTKIKIFWLEPDELETVENGG